MYFTIPTHAEQELFELVGAPSVGNEGLVIMEMEGKFQLRWSAWNPTNGYKHLDATELAYVGNSVADCLEFVRTSKAKAGWDSSRYSTFIRRVLERASR